jgi:hypothetical protein
MPRFADSLGSTLKASQEGSCRPRPWSLLTVVRTEPPQQAGMDHVVAVWKERHWSPLIGFRPVDERHALGPHEGPQDFPPSEFGKHLRRGGGSPKLGIADTSEPFCYKQGRLVDDIRPLRCCWRCSMCPFAPAKKSQPRGEPMDRSLEPSTDTQGVPGVTSKVIH